MSDPESLPKSEKKRQLGLILKDSLFQKNSHHAKALAFVVQKELAGEGHEIKEATIAEHLERPSNESGYVRRLMGQVRLKLADYYYRDPERSDAVTITIPKGEYKPDFQRRLRPAGIGISRIADNSNEGMAYVVQRLAEANCVLNTHTRFRQAATYPDATVRLMRRSLSTFLARDTKWTDIVGGHYDRGYFRGIGKGAAASRYLHNWFVYQIDVAHPFMNFMVLEFADGSAEVLFGWGRYNASVREPVFLCREPDIVTVFRDFFQALLSVAGDPVPARKLFSAASKKAQKATGQ